MQAFIPLVVGIKTKSDGGSWGDAIVAGVKSWAVQQVATSPSFESAGAAVGTSVSTGLQAAGIAADTAAAIGGVVASASSAGLASGSIQVVSGESFTDGFTSGFVGDVVAAGTGKVLGYIESKLPDGLKYETQARNADGQIVDASGRRVYNSKPGSKLDDLARPLSDGGVLRQAANVLETFPPVVQDMISTAIAAELQGKDVTPEMMYGVMANAYITSEAVSAVMTKIPGVDFSSDEGKTS